MDAYSVLVEKLGKEEAEQRIAKKIGEMGGFLTREAAVRVVTNEAGLQTEEKAALSEIEDGANRKIVIAKIARVLPLQKFESGKKMRKVVLADSSGERELKLWNDDAERTNSLHAGDVIEIRGIYCKNNELSLGYSGNILVVEHATFANLGALADLEGEKVNARGYVESIEGEREYERDGRRGKFFSFALSDGKNAARVVIWETPERGKELVAGSEVKVENANVKGGELQMGAGSRLLVKKKKHGLAGKLEEMEVADGKLALEIGGQRHEFSRDDALAVLGTAVAEDIKLETVVELKKKELLGKEIFIEKKDGTFGKAVVKN